MGGRGSVLSQKQRIVWRDKLPFFSDSKDAALWEARMAAQNRIPLRLKIIAGEFAIGIICWIWGWLKGHDPSDTQTEAAVKQRVKDYLDKHPSDENVKAYFDDNME